MNSPHGSRSVADRRTFLVASTAGFAGLSFGSPKLATATEANGSVAPQARAKSTILFFLCGGSSHLDMWDLKPEAPVEYRGPFQPIASSAPGVMIGVHLPLTAQQAHHHFAIVRSVGSSVNTNDHHAGYYYNLTGHEADPTFLSLGNNRTPMPNDWPYMGCVVGSRVPSRGNLPGAVTLPHMPSRLYRTHGPVSSPRVWASNTIRYNALGSLEEPLKFEVSGTHVASWGRRAAVEIAPPRFSKPSTKHVARLKPPRASGNGTTAGQGAIAPRLGRNDGGFQRGRRTEGGPRTLRQHAQRHEPVGGSATRAGRRAVRHRLWKEFGDRNTCKNSGWDTTATTSTASRITCCRRSTAATPRCWPICTITGLLDSTLVVVTSEMGRTPKIGDRRSGGVAGAGRDHWTHCQSVILAGGGIRGGQVYGGSDRYAEYPKDKRVTPAHIAQTVYRQMGVTNLEAKTPTAACLIAGRRRNP